jgi:serine protease Do
MMELPRLEKCFVSLAALFALLFAGELNLSHGAAGRQPLQAKTQTLPDFADLAEKLSPIVVNISTTQVTAPPPAGQPAPGQPAPGPFGSPGPFGENDPFGEFWRRFFGQPFGTPRGPQRGLGSGFIIDKQGMILTNNHVVENAEKITVKLFDDREFEAKVVGRDPRTDIAVVQITGQKGDLPIAPMGNSEKLRVGEWVMAMGSPFGLERTVTAGIVSAKGRHIGAGPYDDFIQTDASINPGNSGGPLINLQGEIIGINTAIFSRTGGNLGIGFAIPIDLAKEIVPELIKKGKVTRGWLGVTIQRMTPEIAESLGLDSPQGALVASVAPNSPADQAGLRPGDVIVEYNGQRVQESTQLPILVARTDVGKDATLTVLRDKKRVPVTVKIGELKDEEIVASAPQPGKLGLAFQNVTPELAESLGLDRATGAVVTAVQPGSPAAQAGLQPGDVILEVNRNRISDVAELQKMLAEAKGGTNLLFLVRRAGNNIFLALKQPDGAG